MMKRRICLFLALMCLISCLQPMQVFAAGNSTGWVEENGNTYYFDPETGEKAYGTVVIDGKMCKFDDYGVYIGRETPGWIWVNGYTYYVMDVEGSVATGWKKIEGYWYYFNAGGHMQTGWLELGSNRYYLDVTGSMVTGEYIIDGITHIFNSDGVWQGEKGKKTGWNKENGIWYYYMHDGTLATGLMLIDGKLYVFDDEGKMFANTLVNSSDGTSYYASASGALLTGWQFLQNNWYYFYKDGHMAKSTYIGYYHVNEKGILIEHAQKLPLTDYYSGCSPVQEKQAEQAVREIALDALRNGGETDYEKVCYAANKLRDCYSRRTSSNIPLGPQFSIYGPLLAGIAGNKSDNYAMGRILDIMGFDWIPGDVVFLKMDGEYGWVDVWEGKVGFGNRSDDGNYTPINWVSEPTNTKGTWQSSRGKWYFKNDRGQYVTGWLYTGNHWYYLNKDGVMKTGWLRDGGTWYYFSASGSMYTGWLCQSNTWYFLQKNGAMATGKFYTMGNYYYADTSGRMITGWKLIGGKWYYADANGVLAIGIKTVGGKDYCFNQQGQMLTGWFQDDYARWYYADANGALTNGWVAISGTYYYFYKDHHMAANTYIDNYFVNQSGAWVSSVSVNRDPQHYKGLTVEQAAQADAVAKAIADDAVANGGETDFEKISYAAIQVGQYVRACSYGNDNDKYYRSPYGVFVAGVYTCAGATRAMGRVLELMGYKWYHPGENQWDHQWVCVKIDGEYGWIDVQKYNCYMGFGNLLDNYVP